MINFFKISQRRRKKIAAILLINFLFSTVLFAFPQQKCDGKCSIDSDSHKCSDRKEMTCCDMMDKNQLKQNSFEMEISAKCCNNKIELIKELTLVIPKTVDTKSVLIEITDVLVNCDDKQFSPNIISQNAIPNTSPPIFLTKSSFLI